MSDSAPAEDPAAGTRAFAVVTALFLAGCLAAGYAFATADGRWPLWHPWAPFGLSGLGLILVLGSASKPREVRPLQVMIGLALAAALVWLVATALVA